MKCPSESAESWTSRLKVFISSSVYRTIDPGTSSVVASSSCLVELLLAIFWPRRVHRIFSLSQCRRRKRFFMLLQWFLVHIKTGRNRWLTLKNAFVCRLLKCKLPVPSLDLSVIGVFIHFNRGYCTVGVRWGFFFFFFLENFTAFLLTTSDRKYSYNFATTVISQDDHLTAGAWAACGLILRIIQLNVIDPSPGKWLVTIPRPHYTRHGKGCHNS